MSGTVSQPAKPNVTSDPHSDEKWASQPLILSKTSSAKGAL
jgi:hypothetical protein